MRSEASRYIWIAPIVLSVGLVTASAAAQEVWTILPVSARGIDPNAAATFRDLLQAELSVEQPGVTFITPPPVACADAGCARDQGALVGADVSVFGSLSALGSEIVVTATAVEVTDGSTRSAQRMTVSYVEELDTAAERIARAIAQGVRVSETAQLGSITDQEARPELRREGDSGFGLRLGGMVPLSNTYGGARSGIGIDLAYWFETPYFAIEPRIGFRFATDRTDHRFFELPIDIGVFYIFGLGDIAPFVGGGTGVHFVSEDRPTTFRTGTVVRTEMSTVLEDRGWGVSAFARLGLLFLRTYTTRVAITVDYSAVFLDLNESGKLQSMFFGVSVIF